MKDGKKPFPSGGRGRRGEDGCCGNESRYQSVRGGTCWRQMSGAAERVGTNQARQPTRRSNSSRRRNHSVRGSPGGSSQACRVQTHGTQLNGFGPKFIPLLKTNKEALSKHRASAFPSQQHFMQQKLLCAAVCVCVCVRVCQLVDVLC